MPPRLRPLVVGVGAPPRPRPHPLALRFHHPQIIRTNPLNPRRAHTDRSRRYVAAQCQLCPRCYLVLLMSTSGGGTG